MCRFDVIPVYAGRRKVLKNKSSGVITLRTVLQRVRVKTYRIFSIIALLLHVNLWHSSTTLVIVQTKGITAAPRGRDYRECTP